MVVWLFTLWELEEKDWGYDLWVRITDLSNYKCILSHGKFSWDCCNLSVIQDLHGAMALETDLTPISFYWQAYIAVIISKHELGEIFFILLKLTRFQVENSVSKHAKTTDARERNMFLLYYRRLWNPNSSSIETFRRGPVSVIHRWY